MTRRTLADYLESGDCPETDDELYDLLDEAADAAESAIDYPRFTGYVHRSNDGSNWAYTIYDSHVTNGPDTVEVVRCGHGPDERRVAVELLRGSVAWWNQRAEPFSTEIVYYGTHDQRRES